MDGTQLVQRLGVDPARLEPAPPADDLPPDWATRLREGRPCVACGIQAGYTTIRVLAGHGHRWVDVCGPHLAAATRRPGRE